MSNMVIQLSAQLEHSESAGSMLVPVNRATIEFFEHFQPSLNTSTISLNPAHGLNYSDLTATPSLGFGEFRCVAQSCISDASVFESAASLATVDPALLANLDASAEFIAHSTDTLTSMNEQTSFESLTAELLGAMPHLKHALDGTLSHSELSQLIADIQAQVLELNGLGQDLFGSLSSEIHAAAQDFADLDSNTLLTSMQIDSSFFVEPISSAYSHSLAFETTLDGLFTTPEAFPLTLDFSSPSSVQEASELFASTGAVSSISSSANHPETDGGIADGGGTSSTFS